jgi:deoxyribodipyrimidine photolyase
MVSRKMLQTGIMQNKIREVSQKFMNKRGSYHGQDLLHYAKEVT